jgi:cytochrome c peroxidase
VPKDTLPARLSVKDVPLGLPARAVPRDNPLTAPRVALGRRLFFDPILSNDRTVACASCHHPDRGFSGASPRGVRGQQLPRRAPTLLNRTFGTSFFWDGRSATLEEQALKPIVDPAEMGAKLPDVLARLKADAHYGKAFAEAFDDGLTQANLAKALASFQRVLLRGDSRVDRFRKKGEHDALSAAERHGLWLYESKAGCWRCHAGANFTDERFHNTGVSWGKRPADLGRAAVTKKDEDKGKFKTPTLRGVALTAPYMHDGSIKTLKEVVEFYDNGGTDNPNLSPHVKPLKLTKEEVEALVAFLKAL